MCFTIYIDGMIFSTDQCPLFTPSYVTLDLDIGIHYFKFVGSSVNNEQYGEFMAQIVLPDNTAVVTDTSGAWTSGGSPIYQECGSEILDSDTYINVASWAFLRNVDHFTMPQSIWPAANCSSPGIWTIDYTVEIISPSATNSTLTDNQITYPVTVNVGVDDEFALYADSVFIGYGTQWFIAQRYLLNMTDGYHELEFIVRNSNGLGGFMAQILLNDENLIVSDTSSNWSYYRLDSDPSSASHFQQIQECDTSYYWNIYEAQFYPNTTKNFIQPSSFWPGSSCYEIASFVIKLNFTVESPNTDETVSTTIGDIITSTTTFASFLSELPSPYSQDFTTRLSAYTVSSSIDYSNSVHNSFSQQSHIPTISEVHESVYKYLFSRINIVYLCLIAAAILIVIISICCLVCKHRKHLSKSSEESTTVTTSYMTSYCMTSNPTNMMTIVPSSMGIYVPVFMQYVPSRDFKIVKKIGAGSFSTVSIGTALNTELETFGKEVIIKTLIVSNANFPKEQLFDLFIQEVSLTYFLKDHPNIVKILGYADLPCTIILKYYRLGSLDLFLSRSQYKISKSLLVSFMNDISNGLKYMHSNSVAHCDMKPGNILIDISDNQNEFGTSYICVLNDFGLSQVIESTVLTVKAFKAVGIVGFTPVYAAPELLSRDRFTVHANMKALDVYAYGVILFQVMTRLELQRFRFEKERQVDVRRSNIDILI